MKVIVDTSVWSLVLRRIDSGKENSLVKDRVTQLIEDSRVLIIGPIRQEILSGIKSEKQFNILKERLSHFKDIPLETEDFIIAAEYFNYCRSKGIQGAHTDFLICAVASRHNYLVYTFDKDFENYARFIDFKLYR